MSDCNGSTLKRVPYMIRTHSLYKYVYRKEQIFTYIKTWPFDLFGYALTLRFFFKKGKILHPPLLK